MPAAIQADQLDSIIKTTQRHIEKERMASIAETLVDYVGARLLFQQNKVMVSDGYGIEWNMATDHSHTAMQVGLFDNIAPAMNVHQVRFNLPWRHTRAHVSWDLREVAMNNSPARLVNLVKEKIFEMDVAWIEQLESQFWTGPAVGDDQSVMGIWGYWIYSPNDGGGNNTTSPWTTSSTGGRVNLNPTGYSSGPGNVSRVTYSRSAPWFQSYGDITYDDAVRKLRTGFNQINFKSPVNFAKLQDGNTKFGIYCTLADELKFADVARLQNENVGTDLAYYDGKAVVRGVPIMGVPKLDELDAARSTANHPIFVIDWSQLRPICLDGFAPYEVTETGGSNQPLTVTRARYMTWNMRMWNGKTSALFTSNGSSG